MPPRPLRRPARLGALAVLVVAAVAAAPAAAHGRSAGSDAGPTATAAATATPARHTKLVKSVPAKDSTVTASPEALQLWFSERIELSISRVQLLAPNQQEVALTRLTRDDAAKDAPVVAGLLTELAPGTYTVNWTAGSADGHAVKGSYRFTVGPR